MRSARVQQTRDVEIAAIITDGDMKKKSFIGTIPGLFLLAAAAAALQLVSASSNNCVDIDCLKEKLRLICENDPEPKYLDCQNILRCIDIAEQEIMRECVRGYPTDNESRACNSQDLLARSWCDYTRGAIPK